MHELMMRLDGELKEAGEVVDGRPLVDPSQAKTVRFQNGVPVPTDGPFAEIKESLAGYWIVEVERGAGDRDRVAGRRLHRVPDRGAPGHGRAAAQL